MGRGEMRKCDKGLKEKWREEGKYSQKAAAKERIKMDG